MSRARNGSSGFRNTLIHRSKRVRRAAAHVKKLMSSPAIQFKGSGFYITDYAEEIVNPTSGKSQSDSGKSQSDERSRPSTTSEAPSRRARPAEVDTGSSSPAATTTSTSDTSTSSKTKQD